MLPFPKRMKSDEIELGDEDILLVEADDAFDVDVELDDLEAVPARAAAKARHRLPPVSAPPPRVSRPRLVSSPGFEDGVADECLASIAAETSRTRLSDRFPASIVPPPARVPRAPAVPSFDDDVIATARLPVVTAPPPRARAAVPYTRDSVPGVAAPSAPASAFVRTSSSSLPSTVSSVAPVAMSATPEPTVIVVRQPPRTAWIVASAVIGAAFALGAMHLLPRASDPAPAQAPAVASPAPPPPAASPLATSATAAAPAQVSTHAVAPAPPAATVKFAEEQGVAIVASAAAPAPQATQPMQPTRAAHAAAPAKTAPASAAPAPVAAKPASKASSLGPKLPDGSVALGARVDPAPAAQPAPPAPAPAPAPAQPSTKKKLSPEQELAEAQLKASMR